MPYGCEMRCVRAETSALLKSDGHERAEGSAETEAALTALRERAAREGAEAAAREERAKASKERLREQVEFQVAAGTRCSACC